MWHEGISVKKIIYNFNLEQIANSGQCFRMKALNLNHVKKFCDMISINVDLSNTNIYTIPAFGRILVVLQRGAECFFSCNESEWNEYWNEYFDMGTDYAGLGDVISKSGNEHLIEAFHRGAGIRILKQDLWEMIITFLISQNNNISRIKTSVNLLCMKCGIVPEYRETDIAMNDYNKFKMNEEYEAEDILVQYIYEAFWDNAKVRFPDSSLIGYLYAFPSPGDIPPELYNDRSFGFGYRNVFLSEMTQLAYANPKWIDNLRSMSYENAHECLIGYKGIGDKVANCICLFGLHLLDSFPVDTHVRQLLDKYYPDGLDLSMFKGYEGIIQQYLFYYELCNQ